MTQDITIGKHRIGLNHPTYFIADIAANHDGDLGKAKELIYSCAEAGANAAKFQNFQAETIVSDYGFKALGGQFSHQAKWQKSVFEVYQDASLPLNWTETLKETCEDAGIDYFTSPYSAELIEATQPYVSAWKLGSGDITWHASIEQMAASNLPLIIATGAANMDEVTAAVHAAQKHTNQLILMQCNTNYTASLKENKEEQYQRFKCINLNVLKTFSETLPEMILGLSDHTHGHDTVIAAVGLFNARAVEKHYTLDNDLIGPDHPFSMNPQSWKAMVETTREIESSIHVGDDYETSYKKILPFVDDPKALEFALGDGIKRVEENEQQTSILQRRALRATRNIKAGEVIKETDFFPLRPCPEGALPPHALDELVGTTTNRDFDAGEHISYSDISSKAKVA